MSAFMQYVLYGLLSVLVLCCQSSVVDDEDWIDPYDMENFDPSSNSMKNKAQKEAKPVPDLDKASDGIQENTVTSSQPGEKTQKSLTGTAKGGNQPSCSKESSPCVSLFRQYVKSLLYHIRGKVYSGAEDLNLRVKVTATDVEYLEKYTDPSGSENDFRHVHEILSSMVQLVSEVHHGDPSVQRLWLETLLGMPVEKFLMFVVLAGILILTFVAATKFHFSWWKLTVKLVFFLFVISVFWQWYELYKKEEAKQHMTIMKEMPDGCRRREKDENLMSTIWRSLTSTFTFEKDECLQYYEHMLIDPFWRVTPTQALAKTVIRFFLTPMRDIGEAIREFFTGLLKDLPAQLWPVVLTAVGIFSFLFLFMYFGYRVSLPFGLIAIEPGSRGDNTQVQKAITQQNEELMALKDAQENQMKQIMDILKEEHKALQNQRENQEKILSLPSVQATIMKARKSGDQKHSITSRLPVEAEEKEKSHVIKAANNSELPLKVDRSVDVDVSVGDTGREDLKVVNSRDCESEKITSVQEVSQDEKGIFGNRKASDAESFEEISVSNIEADTIGQQDNSG